MEESLKVALVAPTKFLGAVCSKTRCQIVYAEIASRDPEYLKFYKERASEGHLVILDSSPIIPRKLGSLLQLKEVAQAIKPFAVVTPDVDLDTKTTIEYYSSLKDYIPASKIICNIQGHNLEAVKLSYKEARNRCDILGLPMSLEKVIKREWLIRTLKVSKPCFYLEIYKDPREEVPADPCVIGIATSYPFRLGVEGRSLSDLVPEPKPLDFKQEALMRGNCVESNVEQYLEMCCA